MDWDQATALALLAALVVIASGVLLGVIALVRRCARWVLGTRPPSKTAASASERQPLPAEGAPAVTATDLYVVRSNLEAVSRQIEDLERKLRLSAASAGSRKSATPSGPETASRPA